MGIAGARLVPLEGGFSGETFLAEVAGERTVVRIYADRGRRRGPNAAEIDAAVLRLVHGLLPVPEVVEVRRPDPGANMPALLVTTFLPGERLDLVLSGMPEHLRRAVGHDLGALLSRLSQMPMLRPGMFLDGDLRLGPLPAGAGDLVEWVETHLADTPLESWDRADLDGLLEVADRAQSLLDTIDRTCLVHSDFNPKNLLVDPGTGEITGLLDWEFAHAGLPVTDLGNLLRCERDEVFMEAVLAAYSDGAVDAPENLLELARAADLWALVELAARGDTNPVARQAHDLLLRMVRA